MALIGEDRCPFRVSIERPDEVIKSDSSTSPAKVDLGGGIAKEKRPKEPIEIDSSPSSVEVITEIRINWGKWPNISIGYDTYLPGDVIQGVPRDKGKWPNISIGYDTYISPAPVRREVTAATELGDSIAGLGQSLWDLCKPPSLQTSVHILYLF